MIPQHVFRLSAGARILISPATFKESLTAREAALAMAEGVHDVLPAGHALLLPVADGGEGLVQALAEPLHARLITTAVHGPLPDQHVDAVWAVSSDGETAIIEMAAAAGLTLVQEADRDPRWTTTYGVGELIRAALDAGVGTIILGLGGSGTSDAGAGMGEALGVRFLKEDGSPVGPGGQALAELDRIDCGGLDSRLLHVSVVAAVDVRNPLTGPQGAAAVYGPQKGLKPEQVRPLDLALEHFARIAARDCGAEVSALPGAGAAGGLGAGAVLFCHAVLRPGIHVVLDAVNFDALLRGAELVLTGEGSLDAQTAHGKAIQGILERAGAAGIPVAAIAGRIGSEILGEAERLGFSDMESLVDPQTSPARAIREARQLVRMRTSRLIRRHL